jgi:hypothetical protein
LLESKSSGSDMPIFDRYIAVDWSANSGPKTGRDSIWIGEATASGLLPSRNPSTRALAMADIEATLLTARSRGERVLVGFDFVFGFPAGAAEAIAAAELSVVLPSPLRGGIEGGGPSVATAQPPPPTPPLKGGGSDRAYDSISPLTPADTSPLVGEAGRGVPQAPWSRLWSTLHTLITDTDQNLSNRFDVAAAINRATTPRFWGHPHGRTIEGLSPTRTGTDYSAIAERRRVESGIRGPQPVWKLTGVGAVGSQTLLGIPRLEALRRHPLLGRDIAVWPFDTDFERNLAAPITLVEIYPSLFPPAVAVEPRDRAQVETCVLHYAELDAMGLLATFLSAPADLSPADRAIAVAEEGWIAGVGHEALRLPLSEAA